MNYAYSCIGPDDVLRMRDEYAFLSRQLQEVTRLAAAGDRAHELMWEVFVRELEYHMRYEENLLFPAFARSGDAQDLWTDRLQSEHADIRGQCRVIGGILHQPVLCIERLRHLASALLEHKEREGIVLYPWLASLKRPHLSWGIMSLPRPPLAAQS